jgi:hypothetical protein
MQNCSSDRCVSPAQPRSAMLPEPLRSTFYTAVVGDCIVSASRAALARVEDINPHVWCGLEMLLARRSVAVLSSHSASRTRLVHAGVSLSQGSALLAGLTSSNLRLRSPVAFSYWERLHQRIKEAEKLTTS